MDEIKLELFPGEGENTTEKNEITPANADVSTSNQPMTIDALSEDERKLVKDFMEKIDISDSNLVVTYGSSAQNKIAQFSDNVLDSVKTKDMGEAGKLLSNLVVEIQNFEEDGEEKKGLFKLFSGAKKSYDKIIASYSKAETNIDKISSSLEGQRRVLLKDIEIFDAMYENNHQYFKELSLYIVAGNEKLREINEVMLPELKSKAEASKDEIDAQKYNDMVNAANRFEKKIHDLTLSRAISLQMAPQIRLLQNNDAQLADKIHSSLVNSIPLWKNQMVIALGLANSKNALEMQRKVTDMTNDLLRKNSEMLKQGSLDVARESERSIISIETVQQTNKDLLDTIYGIIEIQEKGKQDRAAATTALVKIEDELKTALLATRGK
jgi:uncharacterized protein YaaN involved in tellurite resistance